MATRKQDAPFQPRLSEFDVATAVAKGNVQQGVEEKAFAGLISATGKIATDAHQGYREASLETELEDTIENYYREEPDLSEQIKPHTDTIADLTHGRGAPEEDPLDADEAMALSNAKREVTRLKNAQQNGELSVLDLKIRLERITKEHINRMPGMATPLRNIFSGVLGDRQYRFAEAESIEKQQAAAAKKAGAFNEFLEKEYVKRGIDSRRLGPERSRALLIEKNDALERKAQIEAAIAEDTYLQGEVLKKPKYRQDIWDGISTLTETAVQLALGRSTHEDGTEFTADDKLAEVKRITQESILHLQKTFPNHISDPLLTSMTEALESRNTMINGIIRGEGTVAAKRNAYEAALLTEKNILVKNKAIARMITKISMDPTNAYGLVAQGAKVIAEMGATFARHDNGLFKDDDGNLLIDKDNAPLLNFVTVGIVRLAGDSPSAEGTTDVSEILGTLEKVLESPTWENDPELKGVKSNDALLDMVNNPAFFKIVSGLANETEGKLLGATAKDVSTARSVLDLLNKRTKTYIENSIKPKFFGKFNANAMALNTDPSGGVRVSTFADATATDRAAAKFMNETYLSRIDKYIRAQVALGNVDAPEEFRKNFYAGLEVMADAKTTMGTDNSGNPLPISVDAMTPEQAAKHIVFIPGGMSPEDYDKLKRKHNKDSLDPKFNSGAGPDATPEEFAKPNPYDSVYIPTPVDLIAGYDVDWTTETEKAEIISAVTSVLDSIKYNIDLTTYVIDHLNLRGTNWGRAIMKSFSQAMAKDPNTGRRSYWNTRVRREPSEDAKIVQEVNKSSSEAPNNDESILDWDSM